MSSTKSEVMIVRTSKGLWALRLTSYNDLGVPFYGQFKFKKLIDAIAAANLLRVHIDNIDELPLNQFTKVA